MRDRRYVDELTLEELEEVLRVRRREERLKRLGRHPKARDPLTAGASMPVTPPTPRSRIPLAEDAPRYSAVIQSPQPRQRRRGVRWDWVFDRLLLLVEMAALIGFLVVVARMFITVQGLNEETRAAQAAPTPTSTPMIGVVLLPSGHTPPDALGRSQPEEVPPHLRDLVSQVTPLPVPTPGPEQAQRIVIPSIGVDAPVVEGDDWESLKKGAGHHIGSANPGERGNCIISAHNDVYGEIFRDLPKVKIGDEIFVHTRSQVYRYVVQQTRIIAPTEVSVMAPTSTPVLTLISCYPYGVDTHRIVVIAALE